MHFRRLLVPLMLSLAACNLPPAGSTPSETAAPAAIPTQTDLTTPESSPGPSEPPPTATPEFVSELPDPSDYQWSVVADGFQKPVAVGHAGDSRFFVVEQRGVIRVLQDGVVLQEPFLDIRDRVNSSASEQGLLGLAFDPEFARTGHFYVDYTDAGGDTVISRFTATLGEAQTNPATEAMVLRIDQPFANHNGGDLHFGPDGFLYIATGDGGSANDPHGNGQNPDTLLGNLLRIKVGEAELYAIPGDNPFAAGGGRPEIWAYGLRNPWRFSFDSLTGDLYIGDVGQNAWEEIDFLAAGSQSGANFGWNLREGMHPFASQATEGLVDPIAEYPNPTAGCSVTGGVVVRDPELPAWQGVYLYGDYCSGGVWGLLRDAGGQWRNSKLFSTPFNISSFGTGTDGAVYLADHNGVIYRLEPGT
ncbi:MAG: PQQ-dependent sugar dehydrogenase [Anaerolineae bacterium]|nr:MAG: PQQ-dependent sugar dehydrogenase [Anaerolineae bacterium]